MGGGGDAAVQTKVSTVGHNLLDVPTVSIDFTSSEIVFSICINSALRAAYLEGYFPKTATCSHTAWGRTSLGPRCSVCAFSVMLAFWGSMVCPSACTHSSSSCFASCITLLSPGISASFLLGGARQQATRKRTRISGSKSLNVERTSSSSWGVRSSPLPLDAHAPDVNCDSCNVTAACVTVPSRSIIRTSYFGTWFMSFLYFSKTVHLTPGRGLRPKHCPNRNQGNARDVGLVTKKWITT